MRKQPKLSNDIVKFGISKKLNLAFFVIILVAIIIISTFIYFQMSQTLRDKLVTTSEHFLAESARHIEAYFEGYEKRLRQASLNETVINFKKGDDEKLYKVLESIMVKEEDVMAAYLATPDKSFYLRPLSDLPDDFDPTIRPWYIKAVEMDSFIWSDPYIDTATKKTTITAAIPIKRNNRLIGVLALDLDLYKLSDMINQISVADNGYPILSTAKGQIISHRDPEQIGQDMPVKELYQLITSRSETTIDYKYQGRTKFAISKNITALDMSILAALEENEYTDDVKNLIIKIAIAGIVTLIVALVCSWLISKGIVKNIKSLLSGLTRVKSGDLTTTFPAESSDEIRLIDNYLNETVTNLNQMMQQVKSLSIDLSESSQTLAATAEQTSASADEVSRTVEEIASGASAQAQDADSGVRIAQVLADKFSNLNEKATAMIGAAKEVMGANKNGVEAVDDLKVKTKHNDDANNNIESVVMALDSKTQSIDAILNSISTIAEQTNLLALNASIEAARAGEHGRGFAVVADEIRKLAEDSSKSADEVRQIVSDIQNDSTKTVDSVKRVKAIAVEQSQAVDKVNQQFDVISHAIENIATAIEAITDDVNVLNSDKDQIVSSIQNIASVSEQTAAASEEVSASMNQQTQAVEEVAKAAERMSEIAVVLNDQVTKFKVE